MVLIEEVKAKNGRTGKLWFDPARSHYAIETVEVGHKTGLIQVLEEDIERDEAYDIFQEICGQYGIYL